MKKFTMSLKKAEKDYKYSEYKQQIGLLIKNIIKDAETLNQLRSSMSMKIQDSKAVNTYEKKI